MLRNIADKRGCRNAEVVLGKKHNFDIFQWIRGKNEVNEKMRLVIPECN